MNYCRAQMDRFIRKMRIALQGLEYAEKWATRQDPQPSYHADMSTEPNPLKIYFDEHQSGRGIWKWDHYFDIYHRHFQKFVGREVHVLEVGVFSGGSLEMWRNYFGPQCFVYGVDKDEVCKEYENEWTRIFVGDQADRDFWRSVKASIPKLDVIIDDGGHQTEQQIVTLEEMLPHVSPGGVFACEDIGGDLNGFYAYVAGLGAHLNELDSGLMSVLAGGAVGESDLTTEASAFQSAIASIHLYPFIVVIEKAIDLTLAFTARRQGSEWLSSD
jgi:hypothetical protein